MRTNVKPPLLLAILGTRTVTPSTDVPCVLFLPFHNSAFAATDLPVLESHYQYSAARGGGGSFKNRKPTGEIGCGESPMAEQKH